MLKHQKMAVKKLWIRWVRVTCLSGNTVYVLCFSHSSKLSTHTSTHFLLKLYTVLMNNIFDQITDWNHGLYTSSTLPTKTIYLNKKEILI